jgi:pre-rRNA-processing protein TSR3
MIPTIIWRHRKENIKKCSLRGLEQKKDFLFVTTPKIPSFDHDSYFLLSMDGPVLGESDKDKGILLIDGTWKYAAQMEKKLPHVIKRRLPPEVQTAYPRKQTLCPDPDTGLASIEALYIAFMILGKDTNELLFDYYWKEPFLRKNKYFIQKFSRIDQ